MDWDSLDAHWSTMNESLVRESIIFPFLRKLGYDVGGPHRVRTEEPLKYSLGRAKPSDPVMRGYCDYVCEVESYGRWVIEAKGGRETLTPQDAAQAHSYTYHPAIAGFFYLVSNGGHFRLYDRDPEQPILEWRLDQMNSLWSTIVDLLGPDAIRRRAMSYRVDVGRPLAPGLPSRVAIVGGYLTYESHTCSSSDVQKMLDKMNGTRGTFTGGQVARSDEGLISARVEIVAPFKAWDNLNVAAGIREYPFQSAVEQISRDPEHPTIFQGTVDARIPPGLAVPLPTGGMVSSPVGILMRATTEAVGFVDGFRFQGGFRIRHEHRIDDSQPINFDALDAETQRKIGPHLNGPSRKQFEILFRSSMEALIAKLRATSEGSFEMVFR